MEQRNAKINAIIEPYQSDPIFSDLSSCFLNLNSEDRPRANELMAAIFLAWEEMDKKVDSDKMTLWQKTKRFLSGW